MTSYCTRQHPSGPREITAEEYLQFLLDNHLCPECAGISDSDHAQAGVARHRQSTVPGEVV